MFKIIEGDFKNNKYSDEEYLDNWPMLYILENGRQAYIGESSHVKNPNDAAFLYRREAYF